MLTTYNSDLFQVFRTLNNVTYGTCGHVTSLATPKNDRRFRVFNFVVSINFISQVKSQKENSARDKRLQSEFLKSTCCDPVVLRHSCSPVCQEERELKTALRLFFSLLASAEWRCLSQETADSPGDSRSAVDIQKPTVIPWPEGSTDRDNSPLG